MTHNSKKRAPKGPRPGKTLIFRRYRTVNGKVLDAHDYGLKAWPMSVKK
jgi:hypothetical protein